MVETLDGRSTEGKEPRPLEVRMRLGLDEFPDIKNLEVDQVHEPGAGNMSVQGVIVFNRA